MECLTWLGMSQVRRWAGGGLGANATSMERMFGSRNQRQPQTLASTRTPNYTRLSVQDALQSWQHKSHEQAHAWPAFRFVSSSPWRCRDFINSRLLKEAPKD